MPDVRTAASSNGGLPSCSPWQRRRRQQRTAGRRRYEAKGQQQRTSHAHDLLSHVLFCSLLYCSAATLGGASLEHPSWLLFGNPSRGRLRTPSASRACLNRQHYGHDPRAHLSQLQACEPPPATARSSIFNGRADAKKRRIESRPVKSSVCLVAVVQLDHF